MRRRRIPLPRLHHFGRSLVTCLQPASTRRAYPLRYWSLVAIMIGVPNLLKFDTTGLTHNFGLFNITSLSSITLTIVVALLLALTTVVTRSPLLQRKVEVSAWLWISLLMVLTVSSFLQPSEIAGHQVPEVGTDLLLSLYRLGEWTLVFILLLSVYSRESEQTATDMIIGLIGMVSWVKVIMIWAMLPIVPSLVYSSDSENGAGIARLGGTVLHPVYLAVFASVAFFYSLMFARGGLRFLGCCLALLTLGMTYARSEQLIFVFALLAYLLTARNRKLKVIGVAGILGMAVGVFGEFGALIRYLARGEGASNIATLSERTIVWNASFKAFWLRPGIGYGYIAGPKQALRAMWGSSHWLPPHSHNDFIQALLSGGIPACILVTGIYCAALWRAFRGAQRGPEELFLLIVFAQLVLMSMTVVIVMIQFCDIGNLFILCYVGITASNKVTRGARSSVQEYYHVELQNAASAL